MATIYRFVVEQKMSGGGNGGAKASPKSTAKSITPLSMITNGIGGGVNNNRSMRAFNYVANKVVPGYEKAVRFTKASLGLVKLKPKEGGGYQFAGLSASAIMVLVTLAIAITMKLHKKEIVRANKENSANYTKLETGQSAIHGQFELTRNFWTGKLTYKENK